MPAHGCDTVALDLGLRPWPVPVAAPSTRHPTVVDVWRVRHDQAPAIVDLMGLLDRAERERAGRHRHADDRDRFVVGRAGLRMVLARYAGTTPNLVDLEQRCRHCLGAHGPIVVRGPSQVADVHVSATHTTVWTTLAIARARAVGVDIESDEADVTGIADVVATPAERRALSRLPDVARHSALRQMWTCKEAYLKGLGTGLLRAPDSVDVAGSEPTETSARLSEWHLHLLTVDPMHHGALAVEGISCIPRLWTLDPDWASK